MRRSGAVAKLARQITTIAETVTRLQAESSTVNAVALTGSGGGGGTPTTLVSVSSLESTIEDAPLIESLVPASSATPTVVKTIELPSGVKGKDCILYGFFQLYTTSSFVSSQTFDYGFQIDDSEVTFGDSGSVKFTQTSQSTYAVANAAAGVGTGGLNSLQPISFPLSIPSGASSLKLTIRNSSVPLVITPTEALGAATTYAYTGSLQTYTVPAGVNNVYIYLWGAGGGRNAQEAGAGAFVSGTRTVSPGQVLYIVVGMVGAQGGQQGTTVQGGGGSGFATGGGFSGVFTSSTLTHANLIACAGGGGGAGVFGRAGGSGGVLAGADGSLYTAPYATGGTQSAGGISNGGALTGGSNTGSEASGGGGGYYGGGGGRVQYGAGGGGSSYTGGFTRVLDTQDGGTFNLGLTRQPGGTTNPYYVSPRGQGLQAGQVTIVQAITRNPVRVRTNIKIVAF
jgi:hypothetical protein